MVKTMTDEGIVMMATHNVRLVILSVVVAIIASIQHLSCLAGNGSPACPHCAVVGWWCDLYGNWHLVDALHRDACL